MLVIAVDATPLALAPQRGVARAQRTLLDAWAKQPPPEDVLLFAPCALPDDVPRLAGVVLPKWPVSTARRFRRRLPALLASRGARVLYVPWVAYPRTRVPVVATVHELPFVRLGPVEGCIRTWVHRWWLRRATQDCAALVVPSEATREDLLQVEPRPQARVAVIPNGFDPAPWEVAGARVETALHPHIMMVGTGQGGGGQRKKGLDVLREAVSRLDIPGLKVHIVGDPECALPAGWSALQWDLDDEWLRNLVASASVLVHPARSEGFGYPPLEAMAAGTPVVTTDGGALPGTVGDAAVVVPAGDAGALAGALERVLGDASLRERLVAAGRTRARAFPPGDTARRLYDLLASVGDAA